MRKTEKRYLTDDEAESLKAACSDENEQATIRDMLDEGITLQEAIDRRKHWKHSKSNT